MADKTHSSITIDAPAAEIMAVIADLPNYPTWSDGVKHIDVLTETEAGRPDTARWQIESGPIKDTYELQYTWDGDDAVNWVLTKGNVLKAMDGTYTMIPQDDGSTDVEYDLVVDLSIPMIGMLKRRAEKGIVSSALKGLKARVENG